MSRLKALPIKRWLFLIVMGLAAALLAEQLIFQRYITDYVSGLHRSNAEMIMDGVASDINEIFVDMEQTVNTIAESYYVLDYARTAVTGQRYEKAFEQVRPIIQAATQQTDFDHLLVSDITSAWFRFDIGSGSGNLSVEAGHELMNAFQDIPANSVEASNAVMTLDGVTYFCTARALFITRPTSPEPVTKVGLVAALKDVTKMRLLFDDYNSFQNLYISLHGNEGTLVSNMPDAESVPASVYRRGISVLPESLELIVGFPESQMFPNRTAFAVTLLLVGVFSLLLLLMMGVFVNHFIVKPFSQVISESAVLGGRPMNHRLNMTGVPDVDRLVESINEMIANIEDYDRQVFDTKVYLLRNQIDRHFLYNSLISIKTLTNSGENEKAEEMVEGIARLMRFITSRKQEVNIFEEMEIVQRYVNIQNIRFGNKIALEIEVDDRLCQYKTLKLLIQPLVENAFVHGLEPEREGGVLYLRGSLKDGCVNIEVEDRGAGITPEQLRRLLDKISEADAVTIHQDLEGVALVNIQKRIHLAYGNEYGLSLESQPGIGTLARLTLPVLADEDFRRTVAKIG